jgi:hypothetical protein
MNIEEFKKTRFHADMWVIYNGEFKYVISVDFVEFLVGLVDEKADIPADEWSWARCENIDLVKEVLQ